MGQATGGGVRILHAADLHIDSQIRGIKPELAEQADHDLISGATRRAFDNLIGLAVDERVDAVVLAGDIFDGEWQSTATRDVFERGITRLDDEGIPLVFASGNHDAQSVLNRSMRLPGSARQFGVTEAESFELLDGALVVHGQGYATPSVEHNLSAAYPDRRPGVINVGVLHANVGGNARHADYAPCTPDDLRRLRYDYTALGHIHARREFVDDDRIFAAYSGNLQGRSVRETGPKGALLVTLALDSAPAIEFRELDVLRWGLIDVDATEVQSLDDLVDLIRASHDRAFADAGSRQRIARITARMSPDLRESYRRHREDVDDDVRAGLRGTLIERFVPEVVVNPEGTTISPELIEALRTVSDGLPLAAIRDEILAPLRDVAGRALAREDRRLLEVEHLSTVAQRAVDELAARLGSGS